jgi:two-component system, NtrC family, response regulator AtoC
MCWRVTPGARNRTRDLRPGSLRECAKIDAFRMAADKILVVDDERLVRWSLRQKCEEWGYQVIEAEAGEPGLKLAQHESPDLVLLDVRLPDLSGLAVLDQLKKNGNARAIIMITADPQLEDVKVALKLGAYDFVGKPLDFPTPRDH